MRENLNQLRSAIIEKRGLFWYFAVLSKPEYSIEKPNLGEAYSLGNSV